MTTPINPLDGIVRILKADGESTAGTGFFAGNSNNIVTCAHVIQLADAKPGSTVQFVFHSDLQKHTYKAKVSSEGWRVPNAEDIAFLLPEDGDQKRGLINRVSLGTSIYTQGRALNTFGYPSSTPVEGQNGSCLVIGRTQVNGIEVLQLRSQEVSYGFSGAPVWDPASNFVVGMVSSFIPDGADPGRSHQETAFITPIELIRRVNPQLTPPDDTCPYRGFETFDVEHKDVYFGRDEAIQEMIDGLGKNDILAIVGVSGSGKSSLVRAGLARGLSQWNPPELVNRQVCIFKPGPAPFLNLLVALCSLEGRSYAQVESDFRLPAKSIEDADMSGVREVLREQTTEEIAHLLREHCRSKNLLLVADQFERLFTDCADRNIQNRVIDILLRAASSQVKVLIVLRVDFYKTALEHDGLAQAIKHSEVKLLSMSDAELTDTIVKPASQTGRGCEPELVNSLVADIRGRAGDLPLLQFTLKELWETDAASGVLTKQSYDNLGYVSPTETVTGVRGAIIKRAEEIWGTLEKERKDKTAERIFTSLVMAAQPSVTDEDLRALDTSRRAPLTEFDENTREVISELTASFLLTTSMDPFTGTSSVEVCHEALIKNWPRLRNLVRSQRTFLNWYAQKLSPYLQYWHDEQSPREKRKLLLPESMLLEAKQWLVECPDLLKGPPTVYIESSLRKQRWKRIYQGIGLTLVIAVLATMTYLVLVRQISKAEEFHQKGIQALRAHDYLQAELLLAESLTYSDLPATRNHLLEARSNGAQGVHTTSPPGEVLEMTPDAKWLAFVKDNKVRLWDRSTGTEYATDFPVSETRKVRVALSSDGRLMAFGDETGSVRLFDFHLKQELQGPPPVKETNDAVSAIDSVAISPDGKVIAYGNMIGAIRLWSPDVPRTPIPTNGHGETAIHCLGFSPDGKTLVSGAADATLIAWKVDGNTLKKESTLKGHEDFVTSVAFNSARQIASGAADGSVRVWDLDSGKPKENDVPEITPAYLLIGHLGRVNAVAFSRDNSLIISGSEDATIRLWNTSVRKEILTLSTYGQRVNAVAFSDDTNVVSGGHYSDDSNTSVRQWRINRQEEATTLYDTSQVTAVSFRPNDNRLVFGGLSGPLKIYDPDTSIITNLSYDGAQSPIPTESLNALAFSKADGTLAAGYYDGTVQLWVGNDLKPGRQFKIDKPVWGIAFHPTRPWVAVGGQDKQIHIWNTTDGSEVRVIKDHGDASVWTISFNSIGSLMASGGGDGRVRVWSVPDFTPESTFSPPDGDELWGVPFDNTDQKIITGGLDRTVRVWSLAAVLTQQNAQPLHKFESHEGIIQSVAVGATSDWVASAGSDHTVGLWNLQTGTGGRLQLHDRPVWWVTFNHDGKLLASGGLDNRVRIVSMKAITDIRNKPPKELKGEAQKNTCLRLNKDDVIYSPCEK